MSTAALTADTQRLGPWRAWTANWRRLFGPVLPLAACLAWAYWPTLVDMAERWLNDPQYTHGWLVPAFSAYLLWSRRPLIPMSEAAHRQRVWGFGILVLATALRLAGAVLFLPWLDAISLLPSLAALVVLLGGWAVIRWSWPAIAFLAFMPPLPYRLHSRSAGRQQIATRASTYLLQTVGVPATAEGNVIILNTTRLGVVEACSGLSMLVTFFALATAVALRRPTPLAGQAVDRRQRGADRGRVECRPDYSDGRAFRSGARPSRQLVFHDLAGWLMMPVALAMLGAELGGSGSAVRESSAGRARLPSPRRSRARARGRRPARPAAAAGPRHAAVRPPTPAPRGRGLAGRPPHH